MQRRVSCPNIKLKWPHEILYSHLDESTEMGEPRKELREIRADPARLTCVTLGFRFQSN
jgi:hypothetical protein